MNPMRMSRIVTGLFCLLLTVFCYLPLPAQAASSAATRANDDARVATKDYAGQNLREETFTDAKLAGADFSGADLTGAVFSGSDLTGANFQGADLTYAISYLSDFSRADFQNATLTGITFSQSFFCSSKGTNPCANIGGADFTDAIIDREQAYKLCEVATGETAASLGC